MAEHSLGIIGSGPIGQGLATLWSRAGYKVTLGVRSADSAMRVHVPTDIEVGTFEDAARHDVVVLSLRHDGAEAVATRLAPQLEGALVLDTMNAVTLRHGTVVSGLPNGLTEGEWLARILPHSVVVRAFSHIQDELLTSRAQRYPGMLAVGYASNDAASQPRIEKIIADTGYVPIFAGTLRDSAILDPGGAAFPHMFTAADLRGLVTVHHLPAMLNSFNTATLGDHLHADVTWHFPYGPTLGIRETFSGKRDVLEHLERVQASGVRISDLHTTNETSMGAVVLATGTFPTPRGPVTSPIVSLVSIRDGLINKVTEYWDTAAIR